MIGIILEMVITNGKIDIGDITIGDIILTGTHIMET